MREHLIGTWISKAVIAANNTAGTDELVLLAGTYHLEHKVTGVNPDSLGSGALNVHELLNITGAGIGDTGITIDVSDNFRIFKAANILRFVKLSA